VYSFEPPGVLDLRSALRIRIDRPSGTNHEKRFRSNRKTRENGTVVSSAPNFVPPSNSSESDTSHPRPSFRGERTSILNRWNDQLTRQRLRSP